MSDCFVMNEYGYISLLNDFQHIHLYHMVNNHEMQKLICMELVDKFECPMEECKIIIRRTREQRVSLKLDKRSLYITKLDDIHSYFLQFSHNIHFYLFISLCLHTTPEHKEQSTWKLKPWIYKTTSNNIT